MGNKARKKAGSVVDRGNPVAGTTLHSIVAATRSMLADQHFEALSMREVAAHAGITAAAIYRHFSNKDALINYVVNDSLRDFELHLLRAVAPLPVGSFERLAAMGSGYIRIATEHREQFRILFMRPGLPRRKLADFPGQCGYGVLRQCVVEAIDAGTVRNVDPDLVAFFLWSRVHGIVMLMMSCDFSDTLPAAFGEQSPENLFSLTRDLVVSGLRTEPS